MMASMLAWHSAASAARKACCMSAVKEAREKPPSFTESETVVGVGEGVGGTVGTAVGAGVVGAGGKVAGAAVGASVGLAVGATVGATVGGVGAAVTSTHLWALRGASCRDACQ